MWMLFCVVGLPLLHQVDQKPTAPAASLTLRHVDRIGELMEADDDDDDRMSTTFHKIVICLSLSLSLSLSLCLIETNYLPIP